MEFYKRLKAEPHMCLQGYLSNHLNLQVAPLPSSGMESYDQRSRTRDTTRQVPVHWPEMINEEGVESEHKMVTNPTEPPNMAA